MTPAGGAEPARVPGGAGAMLADRYRLEAQLAVGGMGEVWRATDLLLRRTVAVKLLRESLAEDPVVAERFRREALLAASLSHPNMAGVYDYVQDDGRPGIVMELVDGETLAERIAREGRLPVAEAVRVGAALLAALQTAHDAGIVHRDVKPGNVMLTASGTVKVTDFGIARAAGAQTLTETGMVVGTAHYLSPEQASGKPAAPESDQYSVGAILYEALTGHRPFDAETPLAVAMKRLTVDPEPLRSHRPDVPEPVERVVMRALAREPEGRFASADGMRRALEAALAAAPRPRVDPTPTEVLPAAELSGPAPAAAAATGAPGATTAGLAPRPAPVRDRRARRRAVAPGAGSPRRRSPWPALIAFLAVLALTGLAVGLWRTPSGPELVAVPRFTGMAYADAKALAAERGILVRGVQKEDLRPRGIVIDQNVAPGTEVAEGQTITLAVSSGTPPAPPERSIPDLRGEDAGDAEQRLRDLGFDVEVVAEASDEVDEGEVIRTEPAGSAPEGSKVVIVVAENPDTKRGKGRR